MSRIGSVEFAKLIFINVLKVWVAPLLLLFVAPLLLFPGRFVALAWHPYWICLLTLAMLLPWLVDARQWPVTPLDGCLWLILLWLPVNYWASIDKDASWQAIGYLLFGVASYRALLYCPPFSVRPQRLVYLFLLIGLALTLLGPLLLLADPSFSPVSSRFQSPVLLQVVSSLSETINANVLAGALLLVIPLYTAIILQSCILLPWQLTATLRCLWPLMIGVLVITQSRGAWLAASLALVVVVLLYYSRSLWYTPVVLLLFLGSIAWFAPRQLLESIVASSALGGLDGRIEIWERALYALHDFPFTGIGIGTFSKIIPLLYPYFIWMPDQEIPHAHNLFLQIGVDLGLVGLVGQIALWLTILGMIFALLRHREDTPTRTLAIGASGSLLAMFLHGMVDAVTWGNKLAFLPWWLYALITLLFLHEQRDLRLTKGRQPD